MESHQMQTQIKAPKNMKQIGKVGRTDKIYIEDYAVTYLNQTARMEEVTCAVAGLFGTVKEVEGIKEYYIYAAICQKDVNLTENGIPREVVRDIMKKRSDRFGDLFFLGWAFILKQKAGTIWENCYKSRLETLLGKPELLLTIQADTCEEHFFLYPTEMPKEVGGYFIFYAQNDAMQEYLIDWHEQNFKGTMEQNTDYASESCRMYYKEHKRDNFRVKISNFLLSFAILLLLFTAGIGITNMNGFEKLKHVEETLEEFVQSEETQAPEAAMEEESSDIYVDIPNASPKLEEPIDGSENRYGVNEVLPEAELQASADTQNEAVPIGDEAVGTATGTTGNEAVKTATETTGNEAVKTATETTGNGQNGNTAGTAGSELIQNAAGTTENELNQNAAGDTGNVVPVSTSPQSDLPQPEVKQAQDFVYVVEKGDTLYAIARTFYGDISYIDVICDLNKIENKDTILCGQKLVLPLS